MFKRILFGVLLVLAALSASAQVVLPGQIEDPGARQKQQQYMSKLTSLAAAAAEHKFPFAFYFGRALDIEQVKAEKEDQRGIRFDRFNNRLVLAITGNYYVSYSEDQVNTNARVRHTLDEVVRPLLQDAVAQLGNDNFFDSYAFEIAHHVRRSTVGIVSETAENIVFVIPRAVAQRIVHPTGDEQLQAALLDSQVYVNSEAFTLWVNDEQRNSQPRLLAVKQVVPDRQSAPPPVSEQLGAASENTATGGLSESAAIAAGENALAGRIAPTPIRLVLPQTLSALKLNYADRIARMQQELTSQAHFVSYASPEFIGFHEGAFLELPLTTAVEAEASASRYKLAALAFDDHIAHLVRPALAYFQQSTDFDGMVFSTTVQLSGKPASEAVEFFLPFPAMKCYVQYDCTGQQLINAGYVLINGERVSLDLQKAESTAP